MQKSLVLHCLLAVLCKILLLIEVNAVWQQCIPYSYESMQLRLKNDLEYTPHKGRVEVSFDCGDNWGTICSTKWTMREGNVVCRQLNLGYATMVSQSTQFGSSITNPWALVGTVCSGNENKLSECFFETNYPSVCNEMNTKIAVVECTAQSPDLSMSLPEIVQSAYLDIVPLSRLICSLEENCLAADAYSIRPVNPNALRKLLRFTTKTDNVGNADFSPYVTYEQWQWHQCHRHYHSMEYFASFDIYNLQYQKVADGHKASFCLMDSVCNEGIPRIHSCRNRTQGISAGCADIYDRQLDCQWVDVTGLAINQLYILRIVVNPEYLIGEMTFENNAAECYLYYTGETHSTKVTECFQAGLWF